MQFLIVSSLVFYIFADGILIPMFSDCTCKITVRPEFASPQLLLYLGTAPEYLSRSEAFYYGYNPGYAICRNRLHQEMNMILICANLQKFHLIPLLNIQTDFFQNIIYMVIKYCTPILGWKHQMVYQYCYIVTLMYVFAHTGILRRKRRGIQPQEI